MPRGTSSPAATCDFRDQRPASGTTFEGTWQLKWSAPSFRPGRPPAEITRVMHDQAISIDLNPGWADWRETEWAHSHSARPPPVPVFTRAATGSHNAFETDLVCFRSAGAPVLPRHEASGRGNWQPESATRQRTVTREEHFHQSYSTSSLYLGSSPVQSSCSIGPSPPARESPTPVPGFDAREEEQRDTHPNTSASKLEFCHFGEAENTCLPVSDAHSAPRWRVLHEPTRMASSSWSGSRTCANKSCPPTGILFLS